MDAPWLAPFLQYPFQALLQRQCFAALRTEVCMRKRRVQVVKSKGLATASY
jgi:hypothetical protein